MTEMTRNSGAAPSATDGLREVALDDKYDLPRSRSS
jgi:hypothetical protein